ncbi:MAG: glycosyltransferase family 9 protein [Desulfovibrionaceae bacterium]
MRIGIWNTAFLGDTLLTLPLIQKIQEYYPSSQIDFWVRDAFVSLYQEQNFAVYGYNKKENGSMKGLYTLSKKISSMKYDIWINPHPSYRSSLIMYLSNIQTTISYNTPLINVLIAKHTVKRNMQNTHEVQRLFSLLEPLHNTTPTFTIPNAIPYSLQKQSLVTIEKYWEKHHLATQKVLALTIGSAWPTKQWLPEHFAKLLLYTLEHNVHVCFLGAGKKEEDFLQTIMTLANISKNDPRIHIFLNISLQDTAVVLKKSSLCCGNDTGLTHLAWLQQKPTVMLFGPTTKELGFFPIGKNTYSLGIDLECRPCGKHGAVQCPKKHFLCMKNLSPEYVWEYIQKILESSSNHASSATHSL